MKTITISEFEKLVAQNNWVREQDHDIVETSVKIHNLFDDELEEFEHREIMHIWGIACKTSKLDEITITYTESFNYDECDLESLSNGTDGQDDVWSVDGIIVLDENGDEMSADELSCYLSDAFSHIDYSVLEIEKLTDIDYDEESKVENFTLEIDNEPRIRFSGKLIASAASSGERCSSNKFSGESGRWTVLKLYKTISGKFICQRVGRTLWENERNRFSGKVCETIEEVKTFFGHKWLAKELYDEANIDDSIEVD